MTTPDFFEDIKVCLNYEAGTHYPASGNNYLGNLIDALLKHGDSIEKVLNNMRFFYGWERAQNRWENAARTEDDETIYTTISMKVNPKVRLLGQTGLFRLAFYGHHPSNGVFTRVDTFEEQLRHLMGLRVVSPVRPYQTSVESLSTGSCIPKRFDSSLYRF